MSVNFDEVFDFNAMAADVTASRTEEAQKRFKGALGTAVETIKRQASIAGKQVELHGGDQADVFNAMAASIENGHLPSQPSVEPSAPPQAIGGDDVVDAEVENLKRELQSAQNENSRLSAENGRLTSENNDLKASKIRLEAAATNASNYKALLDAANDDVTKLKEDLAEANKKVEKAENDLRLLREAQKAKPAPPQNGASTGSTPPSAATPASAAPQPAAPETKVMSAANQQPAPHQARHQKKRGLGRFAPGHHNNQSN